MKKCEILMDNSTHEVECDGVSFCDGVVNVIAAGIVIEMWNLGKIVGVILHESA